jgi:hypothetical protein
MPFKPNYRFERLERERLKKAKKEEKLRRQQDQASQPGDRDDAAPAVSEAARAPSEEEVYSSSNGDSWYLVRDPESERLLVRHQPNRASGGNSSLISVEDFLAEGHGPQHDALLRLIDAEPKKAGGQ